MMTRSGDPAVKRASPTMAPDESRRGACGAETEVESFLESLRTKEECDQHCAHNRVNTDQRDGSHGHMGSGDNAAEPRGNRPIAGCESQKEDGMDESNDCPLAAVEDGERRGHMGECTDLAHSTM